MPKRPVQIGLRTFGSIGEAVEYIQAILWSVGIKERISSTEHNRFLRDLFDRHPQREEKLGGQDLVGFKVDHRDGGTRCFYAIRTDGSCEHFSYKKCLR